MTAPSLSLAATASSADQAMRAALAGAERDLAAVIARHAGANPALAAELSSVLAGHVDRLNLLSARLGQLETLTLRLMAERSPDALVSTFIEAASRILDADYLTVCLVDGSGQPRHLQAHGFDAAPVQRDSLELSSQPGSLANDSALHLAPPAGMAGLPQGHPPIGCLIGQSVTNVDGQHGWLSCARKPDAVPFNDEDHRIAASLAGLLGSAYVSVSSDVSALRAAHHQVDFLSNHDQLTLLPNRSVLAQRMRDAIATARHGERQIALLLFNLDRLQRINDSLGHETGDAMLQEMARRAGSVAGPHDTLAHMGGDEFVLLLTDCLDSDAVVNTARRLIDDISRPVEVGGHDLIVTASIGISIYPRDGTNPSELLKAADVALSHMKDAGRNGFRFFKGEMNAHALRWMSLETHLRRAIERGELSLHYQPQVSIATGSICSMEALLRWRSPELGQVSPGDFIAMAEDTGLILPIGNWVIRQACLQNKAWQNAGLPAMRVAVNVSAHQFMAGTVPEVVADALRESGLDARHLEVELTESVMMHDSESTAAQLAELTSMGVSISLDDFGTGYSSLGYLSRFMLDKLKIDQSFVRNITSEPRSAAIAQATVALAHGLSLDVIAEGVETEGQLAYLRAIGCDEVQGYLFSRPVPAEDMALLLGGQTKLLR